MSTEKTTTTKSIASWSQFPEYKKFWDAFVDVFWGEGGKTPYHGMITADQEYLKDAYMKNYNKLTELESNYLSTMSEANRAYERGVKEGNIDVRLGGQHLMNLTPRRTQEMLGELRKQDIELAKAGVGIGGMQAARNIDAASKLSPYTADRAYMESLAKIGSQGQQARTSGGETVTEGPGLGILAQGLGLGSAAMDIYKGGAESGLWGNLASGAGKLFGGSSSEESKEGGESGGGGNFLDTIGKIGGGALDTIGNIGGSIWDTAGDVWDTAGDWGNKFWNFLTG